MNDKNLSIISYLTIIGWLVAYLHYTKGAKTALLKYHLRQSIGLFEIVVLYQLVVSMVIFFSPNIGYSLLWGYVLYFIFIGFGMINVLNKARYPIPLIGKFFENKFSFIK